MDEHTDVVRKIRNIPKNTEGASGTRKRVRKWLAALENHADVCGNLSYGAEHNGSRSPLSLDDRIQARARIRSALTDTAVKFSTSEKTLIELRLANLCEKA